LLLVGSNLFMTMAWYGRLKFRDTALWKVITLLVFAGFSVFYLGESLRWNHAGAFVCLVGAV